MGHPRIPPTAGLNAILLATLTAVRVVAAPRPGPAAEPAVNVSAEAKRLPGEFRRAKSADDRQALAANANAARELDPEEARGLQRLSRIGMLVGLPALRLTSSYDDDLIDTRTTPRCPTAPG